MKEFLFTDKNFVALDGGHDGQFRCLLFELIEQQKSKLLLFCLTDGNYYFFDSLLVIASQDEMLEFYKTSELIDLDAYHSGRIEIVKGDQVFYRTYDLEAEMEEAYWPTGFITPKNQYYLLAIDEVDMPECQPVAVTAIPVKDIFKARIFRGKIQLEIQETWVDWIEKDNLPKYLADNYK